MLNHHAYLCRVSDVSIDTAKQHALSLPVPEVEYLVLESFGIGDVRKLTERAYMRPSQGTEQLLVVCTGTVTVEAQQALLKILEEPPTSTIFLFCVPHSLYLLPTLLSRFAEHKLSADLPNESAGNLIFTSFVSLSLAERMTEIVNRLAKKDTKWVDEIKTGLLKKIVDNSSQYNPEQLLTLYFVAEHLNTRGASNKLLLEELALSYTEAA